MTSPELLTAYEHCQRKGFYLRDWQSPKLRSSRMMAEAMRAALTAKDGIWGEVAGDSMMQLAADRGLDTDQQDVYGSVVHHAAIADLLVSAIRKPKDAPWGVPEPNDGWESGCYLVGNTLRRIVLASHWSDERHYSECRSWYTLGECAVYELPMQLVVCIIGQERTGRRHGPWSTGFLHPMNHQLRFRKKSRSTSEVFNDKWEKIFREDHAEISRETWLQAMLTDDVLPEALFVVDIPLPEKPHLAMVRHLLRQKMGRLRSMKHTPEAQLSSCDVPPCEFRKCCWTLPERQPSRKTGFIPVSAFRQSEEANPLTEG